MRSLRAVLAALVFLCCASAPALAKKQREYPYAFDQVWNAALRLVRVDLRCAVTDRDPEGGYVLFEYEAQGQRYPGSIELVAQSRASQIATVAIVNVKGMPSYVEQMILERLEKKLFSEFGPPPKPVAPKPPPAPPAEPDAGVEPPREPG